MKAYPPTPPLSTRAEVERICAENALAAAPPDRLAEMLERLTAEVDRLVDKVPEAGRNRHRHMKMSVKPVVEASR